MISSSYPNPLSPQMKDTFPTSMEIFNSSTEKYNYIFLFDKTKSTFSIYTAFPRFVFVITIYYHFWVCLTNKLTAYLKALPLEKLTIFLLEIYQKLCYFIHEYACFRPEMSAILLKFTKNPKDNGRSTIVRSTKLLR